MNVYTVEYVDEESNFSCLEGIFSTKKKAKEYVKNSFKAKEIAEGDDWVEYKIKKETGIIIWINEAEVDCLVP
jgi:hypothetical protein